MVGKAMMRLAVLLGGLLLGACNTTLKPDARSADFPTTQPKAAAQVAVYFTPEFRAYTYEASAQAMEMRNYNLVLGQLGVDSLRYSLESRFKGVTCRDGAPVFPVADAKYVLVPAFDATDVRTPIWVKFEPLTVNVTMSVRVMDSQGKELGQYKFEGSDWKPGLKQSCEPYLPDLCRSAVKQAVDVLAYDVAESAKK